MTHNSVSGCAHFIAKDDADCIAEIRRLVSFLPSNNLDSAPVFAPSDDFARMIDELNTFMPENANAAYDMKEVIAKIVDNSDYYGSSVLFCAKYYHGFCSS